MTDHPGRAALSAIVEGLKGVTPGPWWADSERSEGGDGRFDAFAVYGPERRHGHPSSICDTHNSGETRIAHDHDTTPWDEQGRVNMDHIARCDPATMQSIAAYVAELEATQPRLRRVRHWKRGTSYEVIGTGKMQTGWWVEPNICPRPGPVDMREVVIYRSEEDGSLWVRPVEEFNDGRFEDISERIVHKHLNIQGAGNG